MHNLIVLGFGRSGTSFVHYDQLFSSTYLQRLETFSQAKLDASFPEQQLKKSAPQLEPDKKDTGHLQNAFYRVGNRC